jgi:uncharacterized RDD family membrane protein YckC
VYEWSHGVANRVQRAVGTGGTVTTDHRRRSPVDRVLGSIVNPVVGAVEPDGLLERIDVNALLERIDMNALLDRIDLDRVLDKVDLDKILDKVDLDKVLDKIDVDQLIERIDVNQVVARVDIDDLVQRAGIEDLVARSSRGILTQLIDLVRRQLVGLDVVLQRIVSRLLRRPLRRVDEASLSLSGEPSGAVSRLAAFAIDSVFLTTLFGMGIAVVAYVADLILATDWQPERANNIVWSVAFLTWAAGYFTVGWAIAGRTPGLGLLGLRVVSHDHEPVSLGASLLRVLVLPTCFVLGLGAIGIVFGRRHRALHDVAAHTLVVYDWGDRPAAAPAPLARWLERQQAAVAPPTTT